MISFWLILFLILSALALPAVAGAKPWPRFLLRFMLALVLSFFGVVLPLFVFFVSSLRLPEWKGACDYGWVDCFIVGKLALTPLVLMATAALYKVDILRTSSGKERWVAVSAFLGAIVAAICLVFGLACLSRFGFGQFMLVPLYVAIWQASLAVRLMMAAGLSPWTYVGALLGSLPFWLASALWSRNEYDLLPNEAPPGCFIVTAASRGHVGWVGPLATITHHGCRRQANQQLVTFWQLEEWWCLRAPRGHRIFRCAYNQIGPVIAARIQSPWLADATWLILKPAEWLATFFLRWKTTV